MDSRNDTIDASSSPPLHFPQKDNLDHTKSMNEVIHNAKNATEKEHSMTLWLGLKLYPKAVAWSMLISTCIVMEGYDLCLLSSFYAFPEFNQKYGEQLPNGDWQIPDAFRVHPLWLGRTRDSW